MQSLDAIRLVGAALGRLHLEGGPGIWTVRQVQAASTVTPVWQGRLVNSETTRAEVERGACVGIMPRRSDTGALGWETGAALRQPPRFNPAERVFLPSGRPWYYATGTLYGLKTTELRGAAVCGMRCIPSSAGAIGKRVDGRPSWLVSGDFDTVEDTLWDWMVKLDGDVKLLHLNKSVTVIGKIVKGFAHATAVLDAEERWWAGKSW